MQQGEAAVVGARRARPDSSGFARPSSIAVASMLGLTLLLLSGCWLRGGNSRAPAKPLTPDDVKVGMAAHEFQRAYPEAHLTPNGEWKRPGEIGGLRGEWTFSFNRRTLSWYIFNSYEAEVDASTFKEYLDATRKILAAYTQRFGSPASVSRGITVFKDPTHGYGGYPVLSASWVAGQESIRIDFSVIAGGIGSAQLLFTAEYRRASAVAG